MKHTFGGSGNKRLLGQYTKGDKPQKKADGGFVEGLKAGLPSAAGEMLSRGIKSLRGETPAQKTMRDVTTNAGTGAGGPMMGKALRGAGRAADGMEDRKSGGRVKR